MLDGILNFFSFSKENESFTKDDVLRIISVAKDNINNSVIHTLGLLVAGNTKNININKDVKDRVINLGKDLKLGSNPSEIFKQLTRFFENAVKNLSVLESYVNKDFPTSISMDATTGKHGSILKVSSDLLGMSVSIMDILYSTLTTDHALPKGMRTNIESSKTTFYALFSAYYNKLDNIVKDINNASIEVVSLVNEPGLLSRIFGSTGKHVGLPSLGFSGNPIYHIRLWLADKSHDAYESMLDRRNILETKIMSLNLDKDSDPASAERLDRQIMYYEEQLDKVNYKIMQYES